MSTNIAAASLAEQMETRALEVLAEAFNAPLSDIGLYHKTQMALSYLHAVAIKDSRNVSVSGNLDSQVTDMTLKS